MKKCLKKIMTWILIMLMSMNISGCSNDNSNEGSLNNDDGAGAGKNEKTENDESTGKINVDNITVKYNGDTPCDMNNCGLMNIMENAYGYYFNLGFYNAPIPYCMKSNYDGGIGMSLAFHDNETNTGIFLCNKPECEHQANEACVATYKNVITFNTVLYEGYLYVYGVEENDKTLSYNLYRVALDGSSIDKVGTAFESVNETDERAIYRPQSAEQDAFYFIIHKGYAYLPYYFKIGESSKGFKGGGLKRMNLTNGDVEDVYSLSQPNLGFPYYLYAIDDYIYFWLKAQTTYYGWRVYDMNTKEVGHTPWDIAFAEKNDIKLKNTSNYLNMDAENDKYGFRLVGRIFNTPEDPSNTDYLKNLTDDDVKYRMEVYEKYRADVIEDKSFDVDVKRSDIGDIGNYYYRKKVLLYDDKLIICLEKKVLIYGAGNNNWGKKLGEFTGDSEIEKYESTQSEKYNFSEEFHVVNGKIYKTVRDGIGDYSAYHYTFYSCPIDKVIKGEGCWEATFTNEWTE